MIKTNVMRIIEANHIEYKVYTYTGVLDAVSVASLINVNKDKVYKTLVTKANDYFCVFMIQAEAKLNLKKAAKAVNAKSVEMIKQKDLLPLTGYIHGGCSPIGMKKQFKTVIDKSALENDTIVFSAGKIGYQVELTLENLKKIIDLEIFDVID